jgi:hypothetical protein
MAPIDINNQNIDSVTVNGTDVQEITVDGDVVFSAQQLPVAYSNLVAWYPMESNIPGGDEYSDATALFPGSGNPTAQNLIDNGAFHVTNQGVNDLTNGLSGNSFENDGNFNTLFYTPPNVTDFTFTFWYYNEDPNTFWCFGNWARTSESVYYAVIDNQWVFGSGSGGQTFLDYPSSPGQNKWIFVALTRTGNNFFLYRKYESGGSTVTESNTHTRSGIDVNTEFELLGMDGVGLDPLDGYMDDVRHYNTSLTTTQLDSIYQNTKP